MLKTSPGTAFPAREVLLFGIFRLTIRKNQRIMRLRL